MASKRAKGYKGTFSHRKGVGLNFYGLTELLQKIDDAGGSVPEALSRAIQESSAPIGADMLKFMAQHHRTGKTAASYTDVVDIKGYGSSGFITYKLGFDTKKGGLPALFLDIGTPTITPSFFVYYAIENNADNVVQAQQRALEKALKELM